MIRLHPSHASALNVFAGALSRPARPIDTSLHTVNEAARLLKLHPSTILRWIREGKVPAYGWRRCYRVRLEEILPPVQSRKALQRATE